MSEFPWYNTYLEGPRWAGIREFVRDIALGTGVEVEIQDEIKSFLGTKVYFRVRGEPTAIQRYRERLASGIRRYNQD